MRRAAETRYDGLVSVFHFDYKDAPKGVQPTRGDFARIGGYLLPAWRPSVLILLCILSTRCSG